MGTWANGIATDSAYGVYLAGATDGALGAANLGSRDAVLASYGQSLLPLGGDLMVEAAAPLSPTGVSSNLLLTLTVTNAGSGPLTGITLSDELPAQATFISASSSVGSWTQNVGRITWSLGALTNRTAVLMVTLAPSAPGILTNQATVFNAEPDLNPCNNSVQQRIVVVANNTPPVLRWPFRQATGAFGFTLEGLPMHSYQIEASTDLRTWTSIGTLVNSNLCGGGRSLFLDRGATNLSHRFYRNH